MGASHIHNGQTAARAALAAACPGFHAHGQAKRTETSLLIPGVLHSRRVIAKYPIDRRLFWLARAHHEITVYRALPTLAPLPVSMPELVATNPTHHLLVITDLAGPPVHPHRYPRATIPPGQLTAVLDLLARLHTWRPEVPSALPSDEDYPRQLAAVRGSDITDVDYHHAVELSTAIAPRLDLEIQHGDPHLGNVIHLPRHQLALIDLEFTAWRRPGYDLAKLWILLGDSPSARTQLLTRIGSTSERRAAFWCAVLLVCLREITSQRRTAAATRDDLLPRLRRDLALTLEHVHTYHRRITGPQTPLRSSRCTFRSARSATATATTAASPSTGSTSKPSSTITAVTSTATAPRSRPMPISAASAQQGSASPP